MKYAALGVAALSIAFLGDPALADCYFGTDAVIGMETIICETDGSFSSWGNMIAEA